MNALAALGQLERLAACLERGDPPSPADAGAFAASVRRFLESRDPYRGGRGLGEALGLALADGEGDPRRELRRERRDQLYAEGIELMRGKDTLARVRGFHEKLSAYFAGPRWKADRTRLAAGCPYEPGSLDAVMWEILKIDASVLGEPRILSEIRLRHLPAVRGRRFHRR